jgi:hypothetical protein
VALALTACKIDVVVGPGGRVVTQSGSFACEAGQVCTVDVVDLFFDETFVAQADDRHSFTGWRLEHGHLCGDKLAPCHLSTAVLAGNDALLAVLESDFVFYLEPEFLAAPRFVEEDLTTLGQVTQTAEGFALLGDLSLEGATPVGQVFRDADLNVSFDENGELLGLAGDALIPPVITSNLGVVGNVRTDIGLFTGAQINADEAFEIQLLDSRQYLVFLASAGVDLQLGDRDGGQTLNISTPLSGKIVIISDPLDEMYYHYGEIAGELVATGRSDNGLIPYVPQVDFAPIDTFLGHDYLRRATSVGVKIFDVLALDGEYVIKNPTFAEINLEDPFSSGIGYFAGYNGIAEISFGVLGFGLFELDLAQSSGSIRVQPLQGATSNRMSVYGRVAPDVSWQPDWFQVFPETELQADLTIDAAGNLDLNLTGIYNSLLPEAQLSGAMHFDESSATLSAVVESPLKQIPVSMTFADGNTHAVVGIDVETQGLVEAHLDNAFTLAEQRVQQAQQALVDAVAEYELELSLNGLRAAIPSITTNAIDTLNAVPGQVYSSINTQVKNEINARRYCAIWVPIAGCQSYLPTNATRDSKAASAASSARSQAQSAIAPYVAALTNLRTQAALGDDDAVREALRQALLTAYDHRQLTRTITVSVSISGISTFSKSYTINRAVLSSSQASQVLAAANNIDRIPETAGMVVSAEQVLAQLPTQQVLSAVRSDVETGAQLVPGISEVGYSVVDGQYSAYVALSTGAEYSVDFNVLDPDEALLALAELLVDAMAGN